MGVYCSHPNLNQPHTQIAGSKRYHLWNNSRHDAMAGYSSQSDIYYQTHGLAGIFNLDDCNDLYQNGANLTLGSLS